MVDDKLQCDFCCRKVSTVCLRKYDCADFNIDQHGLCQSIGPWAACQECAAMIDAEDRSNLALLSAKLLTEKAGISPQAALEAVSWVQSGFWAHRLTPASTGDK